MRLRRLSVVVVGIAAALAMSHGVAIAQLEGRVKPQQPNASTRQQEQPSRPFSVQSEPYEPNCQSPKGRDEADLCAQRRMADAAEWLATLTERQIWVGIGGLAALLTTILLSIKATNAAVRAAKAAEDAVEVTQDTAKRELRAYVLIHKASVKADPNGKYFEFFIELKNFGQTPAYALDANFDATFIEAGKIRRLGFQERRVETFTRVDLGRDAGFTFRAQCNVRNPAEFAAVEAETIKMVVWGKVEYRDVFDRTQTLTFKGQSAKLPGTGWVISPMQDGNSAS